MILNLLLYALLLFTMICAIVGAIAFAIGGFLVWVANREARHWRKPKGPERK